VSVLATVTRSAPESGVMMAGNVAQKTRDAEIFGYQNPFAVLACSADSSGTEIQQYAQRALMERRLAGEGDETRKQVELIERSRDHLKDPIRRFRASVFWLLLTEQEQSLWVADPELKNLAFDTTLLAGESFSTLSRTESVATFSHNMAVLRCADAHRLALFGDLPGAVSSWAEGFEQWSLCLSSSDYLGSVSQLAQGLDDPRINTRYIRQQIEAIPRELLSEPAALASRALEQRDTIAAVSLVDLIRTAPFDSEFIDSVLEMVYRPIARRVENEIDSLERRRKEAVDVGDSSSLKDDLHAILSDFASHTAPDLEQMLKLGDLPGLAEEHARDHAARFLEKLSVSMWNHCDDVKNSKKATQLAAKYADAESLKKKLSESLNEFDDQAIQQQLGKVLDGYKPSRAPEIIEELKSMAKGASSQKTRSGIYAIIRKISESYAAHLFEAAISHSAAGNSQAAKQRLREALKWTTDETARSAIQEGIRRVEGPTVGQKAAAQGTGCLIQIIVVLAIGGIFAAISECQG